MHCVLQTVTRHVRVAATRSQLSVRVGCGDGKKGSPHFGSERLPSAARGATEIQLGPYTFIHESRVDGDGEFYNPTVRFGFSDSRPRLSVQEIHGWWHE